ncbi:MAG: hypothetical protein KatS3mg060_0516 [Dehalococcoidia bacterium]|jgi:hypothetical protein|nr:MAG: hypothetical protein KatS3mg060_0516 [Dehalococcoidia bacterium]
MPSTLTPRKIAGLELIETWLRSLLRGRTFYAAAALSSRRT